MILLIILILVTNQYLKYLKFEVLKVKEWSFYEVKQAQLY